MQAIRWEMVSDEEEVAVWACRRILLAADQAIATRGQFRIVLAGGRTPERTYRLLSEVDTDWRCWQVYFGDERCLPVGNSQRNSDMAARVWLDRVDMPTANIHVIPAELGPYEAAQQYEALVRQALPFDLALLGLGNDGHTASIFPGAPHLGESLVQPVLHAPKAPSQRVTLSAAALNQCREILVLVSGQEKRAILKAWQQGEPLPISALQPLGELSVIYDREAAPGSSA
ncbi:MAG: 6-phosphogluconolactonase [Desulfuromonadales bacterium C00003094]|jgi:6-phosphogluconolactonase|nr:MAG: 6-phosphogluconolactonase [Desulfuromonadales bacterium C00003094]OEU76182.1 MAG: 6-phosphogluconolactonase [Desulfuromonadales bacterium C00003107]